MITLWTSGTTAQSGSNAKPPRSLRPNRTVNLSPSRYFKALSWPARCLKWTSQSDSSEARLVQPGTGSRQCHLLGRRIWTSSPSSLRPRLWTAPEAAADRSDQRRRQPATENCKRRSPASSNSSPTGQPSPAANRAEVALTEAGDLIVGLRRQQRHLWAQGTRIDDSAWEEAGLDALYDLAFGREAFEAEAEE